MSICPYLLLIVCLVYWHLGNFDFNQWLITWIVVVKHLFSTWFMSVSMCLFSSFSPSSISTIHHSFWIFFRFSFGFEHINQNNCLININYLKFSCIALISECNGAIISKWLNQKHRQEFPWNVIIFEFSNRIFPLFARVSCKMFQSNVNIVIQIRKAAALQILSHDLQNGFTMRESFRSVLFFFSSSSSRLLVFLFHSVFLLFLPLTRRSNNTLTFTLEFSSPPSPLLYTIHIRRNQARINVRTSTQIRKAASM